ncbi:MAG: CocE/NonD family hydrolase [Actinomycetota bacterium]
MTSARRVLAMFVVLGGLLAGTIPSASAQLRTDADWSEAYITSSDGVTTLHADILRPKGMPLDAAHKTPVLLTVSPYTNHSGQTTDYDPNAVGPSNRFYDFLDRSHLLEHGYTYVVVDLPGFGGSAGCTDWGGAREQGAVKTAVEWAAAQPWSTGKVALFGKSYDGWTGLMGIAQHPTGLAAVLSLEPVYTGYDYEYMNGVRKATSAEEAAIFAAVDAKPGSTKDSPQYLANSAPEAWCYGVNIALQQEDDQNLPFWVERDLIKEARSSPAALNTPLFMTQGFLEDNTQPERAYDFFNMMTGPKRAWFGQWDHCRPWETYGACKTNSNTRLALGRDPSVFIDEAVRFLDYYVKGDHTTQIEQDPAIEVQDQTGKFRAEEQWPPADAISYWSELNPGSYTDGGLDSATGDTSGIWSFSQPLEDKAWLTGEPVIQVALSTVAPRANLTADVYDVAPDNEATLISRGTSLVRGVGSQNVFIKMFGEDWVLQPGHRVAVRITSANSDWWIHVPTETPVTVDSASIGLPFLRYDRTEYLPGGSTPRLESVLRDTTALTDAFITANHQEFRLPPPLIEPDDQQA